MTAITIGEGEGAARAASPVSRPWTVGAYVAVSVAVAAGTGWAMTALVPGSARPVAVGSGSAWALQALAFRWLAPPLSRGRPVLRPWVGGMAVRFGGLAVLGVAGYWSALPVVDMLVAYGVTLFALLVLEAVWLWKRRPASERGAGRGDDRDRSEATRRGVP